jgi:hypothetical protein
LGTWNFFQGKTAAVALNSTHFTWCRESEFVELPIYSTPSLYGVHKDNFLFVVLSNIFLIFQDYYTRMGTKLGISVLSSKPSLCKINDNGN